MLKIHCTALQLSHMRKTCLVNPAKHNGRPDLVLFHLNHTTQKVHSKQFNKYLQMYSFTCLIFIYGLCTIGSEKSLRNFCSLYSMWVPGIVNRFPLSSKPHSWAKLPMQTHQVGLNLRGIDLPLHHGRCIKGMCHHV